MPLSTPSPNPGHPSSPHPPSEEEYLIRHLRASSVSVHLQTPKMPDIVPIVRRPVKKLNSPPIFEKRAETESNSNISSSGRRFGPTDNKNNSGTSGSKIKRICDGNIPAKSKALLGKEEELPSSVSFPKYDASDFVSLTKQKRNVLPELKVAEQRVVKTSVSLFTLPPLSFSF